MSEITAAEEYDAWFEANEVLFESELRAIEAQLPESWDSAVEVGCGTGLFAARLGVSHGVEPSAPMARRARERGLTVESGSAEDLPLERDAVDLALALGVLGYVDEFDAALAELGRVVEPGGRVVVAFLAAGRAFADLYDDAVARGSYPSDLNWETPYPLEMATAADWRSVGEVYGGLRAAGFTDPSAVQTLTAPPETAVRSVESPTPGHDQGSWIVVRASRPEPGADGS
jgi:SAM-dependent methyltransferase